MAGFARGDLVTVPFPFIEQEAGGKVRPALVLAAFPADAPAPPAQQVLILCEITSHPPRDSYDIGFTSMDLARGRLPHDSTIRLSRVWTFSDQRVRGRVGALGASKIAEVATVMRSLFSL
ncbi:MAG TPA: type II toxin-antitoxin system PemK/MazF family toxin [Chloroflexia bacterium]|nr:type II toxin-antitoxin system PemK/MazF family toxin [Chloroflexia bacterium]